MNKRDIIVIGCSAGGVETLQQLVSRLPAVFPAAVFVVNHLSASFESVLPQILTRAGPLPAQHPVDGQPFEFGQIYAAPPNRHLVLERPGTIALSNTARENRHRPAIDPLFRTAARNFGPRVMGVILSGTLDDGAVGLLGVKAKGGLTIVQDPADALYPQMPRAALAMVEDIDFVAPVAEIAQILTQAVTEEVGTEEAKMPAIPMQSSGDEAYPDLTDPEKAMEQGVQTGITCPECGGVIWELGHGNKPLYRCHTGHVYATLSLLAAQTETVEAALWSAVRSLKEKASVAENMAKRMQHDPAFRHLVSDYVAEAQQAKEYASIIQGLLVGRTPDPSAMTLPND